LNLPLTFGRGREDSIDRFSWNGRALPDRRLQESSRRANL
jgi:hypothetical protein